MGEEATLLPVRGDGQVDTDCLDAALAGEPALVAVQQVNNETGIIQSLEQVSARVRASGGLLLADCAQGAGKIPLPDADFIAISAHKFGGPPGIGALLVKDLGTLAATGGQEKGYRRGTQNLPAAVAMAAALASRTHRQAQPRLAGLRKHLEGGIVAAGGVIVGGGAAQLPSILAVSLPGASREALLIQLDLAGFAVSIGPACSSGRMTGSRVLTAMSLPEDVVGGAIRVSLGPQTSEQDVEAFLNAFTAIASRARAA
jgi:cysteine desulfurase